MDLKEKSQDLKFSDLQDLRDSDKTLDLFDKARPYFFFTIPLVFMYINEDWIRSGHFLLAMLFTLFICFKLLKDNFYLAIAVGYTLFNSFVILYTKLDASAHWAPHARRDLHAEVYCAIFIMLALIAIFKNLSNITLDIFDRFFAYFFVTGSILTIITRLIDAKHTGWGVNASSNGTLLALSFFFYAKEIELHKHSKILLPAGLFLGLFALAYSKAMIGLGSLFVCSIFYFFLKKQKRNIIITMLTGSLAFFVVVYLQGFDTAISLTKRDKIWSMIWQWFDFYQSDLFYGQGAGSFFRLFPKVQKAFSNGTIENGKAYILAHNDFLESLFNIGILGTALWISFFIDCTNRIKHIPYLIAFMLCYFINAMGNFPSHIMYSILMLTTVLKRSINLEKLDRIGKKYDV